MLVNKSRNCEIGSQAQFLDGITENYTPPPLFSTGMTLLSDLWDFLDSGGAAAKSLSLAHTYGTKVSWYPPSKDSR
jgi:hypothetical protein